MIAQAAATPFSGIPVVVTTSPTLVAQLTASAVLAAASNDKLSN